MRFTRRSITECTKPVKATAYIALVRPSVEYVCNLFNQTNIFLEQLKKKKEILS